MPFTFALLLYSGKGNTFVFECQFLFITTLPSLLNNLQQIHFPQRTKFGHVGRIKKGLINWERVIIFLYVKFPPVHMQCQQGNRGQKVTTYVCNKRHICTIESQRPIHTHTHTLLNLTSHDNILPNIMTLAAAALATTVVSWK